MNEDFKPENYMNSERELSPKEWNDDPTLGGKFGIRRAPDPGLPGGLPPGGGLPGGPEGPATPESPATPEAVLRAQELYTVEGDDYIVEFREAMAQGNIERIRDAVEGSLSFMEGLAYGVEADNYDIDDRDAAMDLRDMFISIEGSIARPQQTYVYSAVINGLEKGAREANRYNRNPEDYKRSFGRNRQAYWRAVNEINAKNGQPKLLEEQINTRVAQEVVRETARMEGLAENRTTLMRLKNHTETRVKSFEPAFTYRQRTTTSEEKQKDLSNYEELKPDNGNWMAFYQGNRLEGETVDGRERSKFGEAVDRTERAIMAIASGDLIIVHRGRDGSEVSWEDVGRRYDSKNIYVNGFANIAEFQDWVRTVLPYTDIDGEERMDVLWTAWKMCQWKEEISRVAWMVDDKGRYRFGNPPLVSDLGQKMIHSDKTRWMEYGWNGIYAENNAYREIVDLDAFQMVRDASGREYRQIGKIIREEKEPVLDNRGRPVRDRQGREVYRLTGRVLEERFMTKAEFDKFVKSQETDSKNRTKPLKALSHSGHPMNIGKFGMLVPAYQHRRNIRGWPSQADVAEYTLHEIWWNEGVSFADPDFPWANTDVPAEGQASGEAPTGSVGGWMLDWVRGEGVRTIERTPSPQIGAVYFESLRNFEKIKLIMPGELIDGEPVNPMAWLGASTLLYLNAEGLQPDSKYRNDKRIVRYAGAVQRGRMLSDSVNQLSDEMSSGDYVANLFIYGAISRDEANWLLINFTRIGNRTNKFWEQVAQIQKGEAVQKDNTILK